MLPVSFHVIPFNDGLLPQAGGLLARRHQRDRVALPGLPARFEDPAVAREAIRAALQRKQAGGFAALEDGRLVAYLIGDMVIDNL
jgi:hypothetical protein